jgi:putative flippase GtrA
VLTRYLLASAVALGVDYAVLLSLVQATEIPQHVSAAAAYGLGAVVHYGLSRRFVFPAGWLHRRRVAEFSGFLASGLIGLSITVAVVYVGAQLQLAVVLSKSIAVAGSFFANYIVRRWLVFGTFHRRDSGALRPR